MRQYTVTCEGNKGIISQETYSFFDGNSASASNRFDVDSDLGVGPFYCSEGEFDNACEELERYMKEQWDRDTSRIRVSGRRPLGSNRRF